MFKTILHANDGSEPAFKAFAMAVTMAKQNGSALHSVLVEELPYMPEFAEEVREAKETAGRRFQPILKRVRAEAEKEHVVLHPHVLAGHPVRDILKLAADLNADLIVIGATGHSAIYERMIGSRADRIVQLAQCPVLVVK